VRPGDRRQRPSWIFLGLVALLVLSGAATWSGVGNVRVDAFVLVGSGWLVSLCLHEFGHAFLAYRFGDGGVVERGYLTLNPLKYSNVLLSFVLPLVFVLLGGFGMPGGAVWVDRARIGGRARHSLVSAAGPAFNVVFALGSAAPFWFGAADSTHLNFWAALAFLGFLQVTASVLNLVPMPGLDGYGILEPWLPPDWRRGAAKIAPYGMLLVFALLWEPRVNAVFFRLVFFLADLIGIPLGAVALGDQLFRFWT
jgi:Zn-dependent protease